MGSKTGTQPARSEGAALHGTRPPGWIDKFPAYKKLMLERQAEKHSSQHSRNRSRGGRDKSCVELDPGDFPCRGRPGCSCCGSSMPQILASKPPDYDSLTGPPIDDSYRNVYVGNCCLDARAEYRAIFKRVRIQHAAVPVLKDVSLSDALAAARAKADVSLAEWFAEGCWATGLPETDADSLDPAQRDQVENGYSKYVLPYMMLTAAEKERRFQ